MEILKFKAFEAEAVKQPNAPIQLRDSHGLLRKSTSIKSWNKIGIGNSELSDKGVFATEYIEMGEVIEIAHLLMIKKDTIRNTDLVDYVFKIDDDNYAIGLGCASLYNHRNQPIAKWRVDSAAKTVTFTALRAITPGEEIFVSYGKNYWKSRDISPESGAEVSISKLK